MFFILSKTIGTFSTPSNVLTFFMLGALILLPTRFKRAGCRLLIFCCVLFLVLGVLPVDRALTLVLEERFPAWTETASPPDGMIVLGGPINSRMSHMRGTVELNEGAERFTVIPSLAQRFPNARIVFSGGNADLSGGVGEAPFAVRLLESFGIPRERLLVEDRARNTAENASFTEALVKPKPGERWLLVTSAAHMPRAVGAFRQAGFPVEPFPVDWQTSAGSGPWWVWLVPSPSPLRGWRFIDDAVKEWVGLVAYRFAGYTAELFPGPLPSSVPNPAAAGPADGRP